LPFHITVDGNGNVTDYVDADGTIKAHYEYGPFGQLIAKSGPKADDFTHRFSTKPYEEETGILRYQLRDYIVELARWLSRDPIEEMGGINIYEFCGNEPMSHIDILGERWHYKREKTSRASVWFDEEGDVVSALALMLHLDDVQSPLSWLQDEHGKKVFEPEICKTYTVPNKVIVVLGWHNKMNDLLGLGGQASEVTTTYEAQGFRVVFVDEMETYLNSEGYVNSASIGTMANEDTWGIALFGHGKGKTWFGFGEADWSTGGLVLRHGLGNTAVGEIVDVLTASSFSRSHGGYGAVTAFFCHADAGGWDKLISSHGSYVGGIGVQNLLDHPNWTDWVRKATPEEAP
jgi:RHS repeat-associated protein